MTYYQLRIVQIITETPDAKTFVLKPLAEFPAYKEGQFITLVFQTPHGEKRRSFSFSSAPSLGEPLSITVKKLDNGEFSRQLLYNTEQGDILQSSGLGGFFVLPHIIRHKQFFFLAAGSGITPCYALIKKLLANTSADVVLIYSNKSVHDTIFYNQLMLLEKKYSGRFAIRFLFSNNHDVYNSRLSNWLLTQLLNQYLQVNTEDAMFYLCGPVDYMIMAIITLKLNGISDKNIVKENYNPLPRLVIPKPPDTHAHEVTIFFGKETYKFLVQYPRTILSTAKHNNINLPYSCEAGRCGSCVALCVAGKVWMAYNEVLMEDEIGKGMILTCQSFPIEGDVQIRI